MTVVGRNWGGNVEYGASRVERPTSLDELATVVSSGERVGVVATRHSFNRIGDADVLVDLSALSSAPVIASDGSVRVTGSTSYTEVAQALDAAGWALPNLASLPHVSVAGAIATGTHGSGVENRSLAASVLAVDLMTAAGDVVTFTEGDADFPGALVHLGTLGVVTALTLRTEPTYDVAQTVHDGLTWRTLTDRFDDVFASATSVSVFVHYGDRPGGLWRKQRVDRPEPHLGGPSRFDTSPAATGSHPIPGGDASACTPQLGRPGPWWQRLPHFRHDSVPSVGAEVQSEWFVDRADSAAAIEAIRSIADRIDDVLLVGEIRTVAADDHWMSPSNGRDSTGFHFTWRLDPIAVEAAVEVVGEVLQPLGARPHWGKAMPAGFVARGSYDRLDDFLSLKRRLDPGGTFSTAWFERHVAMSAK